MKSEKKCFYYIDGQCAYWSVGVGKPLPICKKDAPFCKKAFSGVIEG